MRTLHHFCIDGVPLRVYDAIGSQSAQWVAWELQADNYRLRNIQFAEGDVVIDIGAHIGLFSIYLAKKWPCIKVYAFEPFPQNLANCLENLRLNDVRNVVLSRKAIASDNRVLSMAASPQNSGGASAIESTFGIHPVVGGIASITLDQVFAAHEIDMCRLLKIDCEGMEYEILLGARLFGKVEYLAGEFHVSASMNALGWYPDRLLDYCASFFADNKLAIRFNQLDDHRKVGKSPPFA